MEKLTKNPANHPGYGNPASLYDRISNSFLLKMGVIFILTVIMLIPMNLINDLIDERKDREQDVLQEISSKWGSAQVISSPVLAIPFTYIREYYDENIKNRELVEDWLFVLPDFSEENVTVKPEYLKRGIYKSVVYNSEIDSKGVFTLKDLKSLGSAIKAVNWEKAKIIFGIKDVKGLSYLPKLKFENREYGMNKNGKLFTLFPNNLVADIQLSYEQSKSFSYHFKYELKGAKSFNYLPLANQSKLYIKGSWGNPSFNGGFLPDKREILETSFTATWNIPSFTRKLPQQWTGQTTIYNYTDVSLSDNNIDNVSKAHNQGESSSNLISTDADMIQVNFLPSVNNYQKTSRVAKYGLLIIILTFVSLFFTEIIKYKRIHIIQYILIGFAMIMFYSLLLALSEHVGFNVAYIISALLTVLLISSFVYRITKNRSIAWVFAGILGLFYLFIYALLQLRDYSLIVGTIGIFVILAVLMQISTKINWYQFENKNETR